MDYITNPQVSFLYLVMMDYITNPQVSFLYIFGHDGLSYTNIHKYHFFTYLVMMDYITNPQVSFLYIFGHYGPSQASKYHFFTYLVMMDYITNPQVSFLYICGHDGLRHKPTSIISLHIWSWWITSQTHKYHFFTYLVMMDYIRNPQVSFLYIFGHDGLHHKPTSIISLHIWSWWITSQTHKYHFFTYLVMMDYITNPQVSFLYIFGHDGLHHKPTSIISLHIWSWWITSQTHKYHFFTYLVMMDYITNPQVSFLYIFGHDGLHHKPTSIISLHIWSWWITSQTHKYHFFTYLVMMDYITNPQVSFLYIFGHDGLHHKPTSIISLHIWSWWITSHHKSFLYKYHDLLYHFFTYLVMMDYITNPQVSFLYIFGHDGLHHKPISIISLHIWSWWITSETHKYHFFTYLVMMDYITNPQVSFLYILGHDGLHHKPTSIISLHIWSWWITSQIHKYHFFTYVVVMDYITNPQVSFLYIFGNDGLHHKPTSIISLHIWSWWITWQTHKYHFFTYLVMMDYITNPQVSFLYIMRQVS